MNKSLRLVLPLALLVHALGCAAEYDGERGDSDPRRTSSSVPASTGEKVPSSSPSSGSPSTPAPATPPAPTATTPPAAPTTPAQPKVITPNDVVVRAYDIAFGRAPDDAGRDFWLGVLANGSPKLDVLLGLVNSQEFANLNANRSTGGYVVTLYTRILRRAPDGAEVDFWAGVLDRNEQTRAAVASAFVSSAEFASPTNPDFKVFF